MSAFIPAPPGSAEPQFGAKARGRSHAQTLRLDTGSRLQINSANTPSWGSAFPGGVPQLESLKEMPLR